MNDERQVLTHLDCFSGLGAWTLAGSWLGGMRTVAFVENDKRCQDFLAKAWPGITIEPDIRTLDGSSYRGVDILTGGVPCQPASRAGKQRGAADDRWLWPATLRLVAEVRPRCCIFENPPGIADVGLDGILAELESQGYEIAPIFDIPACAVNSPQLRHRHYIVAFAGCEHGKSPRPESAEIKSRTHVHAKRQPALCMADARGQGHKITAGEPSNPGQKRSASERSALCGDLANCVRSGAQNSVSLRPRQPRKDTEDYEWSSEGGFWSDYVWLPCADGKIRRAPGDSFGLVDGLHRSILGALGNSQVPQIAFEILKAVKRALSNS